MLRALKLKGGSVSPLVPSVNHFKDTTRNLNYGGIYMDWHRDSNDLKGKVINNKNVILTRYGDIHPYENSPVFNCETLFLNHCNKNFLAYWLNKKTFPNTTTVYVDSHPCDDYVLTKRFDTIYLHEKFLKYKMMWWQNLDNVKMISDSEYRKALQMYHDEDMIVSGTK